MKKKFKCDIDCANCAAKVERAISAMDGVHDVKVNFMMQKFTLDADDERFDEILYKAIEEGRKIEPDFRVDI
ncbi:MAG: heavy metal-associated domain-containing protein [Bacillota bacterium]|nr:heavy metal-associated domain-containing protein [Bacillota bacterium]